MGQARITVLKTLRAASLLTRKQTPSRRQFAGLTRQTQLLDAGQSALQSRSVANIRYSLFTFAVCFFKFVGPTAAGNWLASRPRACNPLLIILRRASSLAEPFFSPLFFTTASANVFEGLCRSRSCRQLDVSNRGHPRQAARRFPVLETFHNVVIATNT